jgi:hypothetical protein
LPLLVLAGNSDSGTPWEIRYSTDVSLNARAPGQEFSFNFPRLPGSVHYITKPATLAAGGAARATFTVTTKGDPAFGYHTAADNTCDKPAAVHLFLQRQGDDMSGKGRYEFYRWWSNAGVVLKEGSATLDVALKPALWTSVFGKTGEVNPDAFAAAVGHLGNVGVTFGGGCFYGHGVSVVNGSALFTMRRFAVH